ncbi:shikimate kinase [Candidatus Methylopumilus rimovensis]|uniref:Shikimate kinase n=1 Tax=Candidatus Methylopumilus rimovensis TaxID=2588535 RepID=A0AAE6FSI2_9PROT|nr:shikimate kinase [Candidatus Methylopumilus rimovensis]QDD13031.1 shikimate kinase [Candidatus Methylopumilus rimovensis]
MATINDNIFFVGLMGAGKTTIGKLLAKKLKKTFYDTDHEIEKKLGVKVSVIFELEGEEGFRKRETQMIDELTNKKDIILATGGGAVLSEENRRLLKERGKVIYLNAKPQHLAKRMAFDKDRPLLQQGNMLDTLNNLYQQRHPLYLGVSSFVVDTGQQKTQTIIHKIEALLR